MKNDISNLTNQLHNEQKAEKKLEHEVKGMHGELNKVEHEEKKLEAEEHML